VMRVFLFFLSVISMGFISGFQIMTLRHARETNRPKTSSLLTQDFSSVLLRKLRVFLLWINKNILHTLLSTCAGFRLIHLCIYGLLSNDACCSTDYLTVSICKMIKEQICELLETTWREKVRVSMQSNIQAFISRD
jgi:hypothetical protein